MRALNASSNAGARTPSLHLGRRIEARHATHKIWDRLKTLEDLDEHIIELLYTDRVWPKSLIRRFGNIVGVVEGLVEVRAGYYGERNKGRTAAASTTAWLEELIAERSQQLAVWKLYALDRCEQAVGAYELVRGVEGSVVPPECFR